MFFIVLSFLFLHPSQAITLKEAAEGKPAYYEKKLPASSYVSVEVRRLKQARLIWWNDSLAKKLDLTLPEKSNPRFEEEILNAFAYMIPEASELETRFTGESRMMFSDRYGGKGIGNNYGSGRAASAGLFQIKGIGRTPLVHPSEDFDHAHGGASIEEAIREAIWGEILNQTLPHSANRILAIISTGTQTKWADGGYEERALIVREDPLRPAHFMENTNELNSKVRIKEMLPVYINQAFPEGGQLIEKLTAYLNKIIDQYAVSFGSRLYHGATSHSNFVLSGKMIDFGTQTAQPEYGRIQVLNDNDAFGDFNEIYDNLIREFFGSISENIEWKIQKEIAPLLRDGFFGGELGMKNKVSDIFNAHYGFEILKKSGLPFLNEKDLLKNHSKDLAFVARVANQSSKVVSVDLEMPTETSTNHIPAVWMQLSQFDFEKDVNFVKEQLKSKIADHRDRSRLVDLYFKLRKDSFSAMKAALPKFSESVLRERFTTFVKTAAFSYNRPLDALYRSNQRKVGGEKIEEWKSTRNPESIRRFIQEQIEFGQPIKVDEKNMKVEAGRVIHSNSGFVFSMNYNLQEDFYEFVVQSRSIDLSPFFIRYTRDGWITSVERPATNSEQGDPFVIRLKPSELQKELEFVIGNAKTGEWIKDHGTNFKFKPDSLLRSNQCSNLLH